MERIWVAVAPSGRDTRILATEGPGDTVLKARLRSRPRHPRALPMLLEALAQWQGQYVSAALAVGGSSPWFESVLHDELLVDEHTPLYELDLVPAVPPRRRRELGGFGDFRDLHGLLRREVAR